MATVPFTLDPSYGDARLELYTEDSDTVVETITAISQETNRHGLYLPTVTVTGLHYCVIVDDAAPATVWGWGWVNIASASGTYGITFDREAALASEKLNSLITSLATTPIVTTSPITAGKLSLYKDEARLGIIKSKLAWNVTSTTDLTSGGSGTLEFSQKFCDKALIESVEVDDTAITDLGSSVYQIEFPISEAVAEQFLTGTRMTFRAWVDHTASGVHAVLDAGDVVAA